MEVEGGDCEQQKELDEVRHESMEGVPGESGAESVDGRKAEDSKIVTFKLLSPMGGESIEFTMIRGQANRDVQEELAMHLNAIFKLCYGFKEAFEKHEGAHWNELPWTDTEKCPPIIEGLNTNIAKIVQLWSGAARSLTGSEWFKSPFCTAEQVKKLSFAIFNRVVKNAQVLNKCYKSFTSQTYGETSFDQVQIMLDKLQMTDKDVFVDLGSGVGHVVTYAAAYSMAKKCVGIEINDVPAKMAINMKKEFEGMMSWYGKKHRPIEMLQGDFTADEFRNLITKEATVIYMNNFAYEPKLMNAIKQMILDMNSGVRIICTKSLLEEREAGEGGGERRSRRLTKRSIDRQNVDIMLDCEELPLADAPVSWSTGKDVKFLLFTVNHAKIANVVDEVCGSGSNSTRSGSVESVAQQPSTTYDKEIMATINKIHRARGQKGGGRIIRLYPGEEESDDDEEDYSASRKWPGHQHTKKAIKEKKAIKDNKTRRVAAAAAATAVAPVCDAPIKASRVVEEEPVEEPADAMDSKAKTPRAGKRSIERGGTPSAKRRRVEEDKKDRGARATSSMATTVSSASTGPQPEELFPFGKVAAAGHSEDFDKEEAPEWAVDPEKKIGKNYVAVYAPHHSIFEEDLENLPKRRSMKVNRFA